MPEVIREAPDKLSDQMWRFYAYSNGAGQDLVIRISQYAVRSRPSTRHKMKVIGLWDSHDQRSYHSTIKAADVPLPDDVIQEALRSIPITIVLPNGDKVPLFSSLVPEGERYEPKV